MIQNGHSRVYKKESKSLGINPNRKIESEEIKFKSLGGSMNYHS